MVFWMENPKQTWIRHGGSPMKVDAQKFTEDNLNLQLPNDVFFGFSMDMLLLPTIIWNRMVVY